MDKSNKRKSAVPQMRWRVSEYRKDKRTGAIKPVGRSEYVQSLFEMGWKDEQKRDRECSQRLQLDDE